MNLELHHMCAPEGHTYDVGEMRATHTCTRYISMYRYIT